MKVVVGGVVGSCIAFGAVAAPSDSAERIRKARTQYETHLTKIENAARTERTDTFRAYGATLDRISSSYQKNGMLEDLLAARREQERFKQDGGIPDSPADGAPALLVKLQKKTRKTLASIDSSESTSVLDLTEKYIAYLDRLKRNLTKEGEMQAALDVRDEIANVKASPAYTSAQFERASRAAESEKTPDTPPRRPMRRADVPGWSWRAGTGLLRKALEAEGQAAITPSGMAIKGGRIKATTFGADVVKRVRAANALTLEATFHTASLQQGGPARIISCSWDGHNRNVSLCQENGMLVLRLRTTSTGQNGTSPEVQLGKITAARSHHVIVSYRPGELVCILDGERQDVRQISGDLSNWDDSYPLVFGNEYKDERRWHGTITAVRFDAAFTKP